ncbi:AAA family ATPase [Mucilaginibacter sp. SMC90]|uniref:AAA family ATPase n=1 Tax=Mucilaginibacter sp. SMC90 TaxID=2929803 RepID=UPI001FB2FC1F|nr:ATP-binding protein [Mucilaginibacter sp. SMC90]UOE48039.1 AAA family ATPase [Mucilaginibacter sp. SMC90]
MVDRVYLSEVQLSGYKTIYDVHVDFNPGLNIIIGKNGAGKTNFLNFLNIALKRDYKKILNYKTSLTFKAAKGTLEVSSEKQSNFKETSRQDFIDSLNDDSSETRAVLTLPDGSQLADDENISVFLRKQNFDIGKIVIPHGIRTGKDNRIIDYPYSFTYAYTKIHNSSLLTDFLDDDNSYFFKSVASTIYFAMIDNLGEDFDENIETSFEEAKLKEIILKTFREIEECLNETLSNYLPIEEIKFNESFSIYHDSITKNIKIENTYLEYKVQGTWLPFSSLSDGTKRLFCIFSDLISPKYFDLKDGDLGMWHKVVLLEEPELGIHPHQFHTLMTFLKSVSNDVQIILTTHSPAALDIITPEGLDILHICSFDIEKGTQLVSLTNSQKDSVIHYLNNESYLSDYWRYSDLES